MPEKDAKTIRDFLQILLKHKWLMMCCVMLMVFPTIIIILKTEPMYKATTTLLIEQENPKVLEVQDVAASDPGSRDYFETQIMMLRSPSLARKVILNLDLENHSDFNHKDSVYSVGHYVHNALAGIIRRVRNGDNDDLSSETPDLSDPLYDSIKAYLARLDIEAIENSRLVKISFETYDNRLAAKIADVHAQTYIDWFMSMRLRASREASRWLKEKLVDLHKNTHEAEKALQDFSEKHGILPYTDAEGKQEEERIIMENLARLNTTLAEARTERIGLEALSRQLNDLSKKAGLEEAIPRISQNPLIQQLKMQLYDLNRQHEELSLKYGERHPKLVAIKDEIAELRAQLATEVKKISRGIDVQLEVARSRERSVLTEIERVKQSGMALNKDFVKFIELQQEVNLNRQLAEKLLNRAKETSLASGLDVNNLLIVDPANIPKLPSKPNKRLLLVLALFLGLNLGILVSFLREHFDRTFHGPDEVKKYLKINFMGPVGISSMKKKGKRAPELVALHEPQSRFVECLRNVCSNIIFSMQDPNDKTMVFSSSQPFEGKSMISANLAILMAQRGKKVLLVDGDLRMPRIHHIFGIDLEPGLSNYFIPKSSVKGAIRKTEVKNLKVLTAGPILPDPVAILSSTRFQKRIERFKDRYDLIIFDAPPILSATDISILAKETDGVFLVIQASSTEIDNVNRALEQLEHTQARILGAILNRVNFRKERFAYGYYSDYYSYYTKRVRKKSHGLRSSAQNQTTPKRVKLPSP